MEHCSQGNLEKLIGKENNKTILYKIGREIAEAIKYLHEMNVVHRKLNLSNILLQNGTAKVSEVGIMKIIKMKYSQRKLLSKKSCYLAP